MTDAIPYILLFFTAFILCAIPFTVLFLRTKKLHDTAVEQGKRITSLTDSLGKTAMTEMNLLLGLGKLHETDVKIADILANHEQRLEYLAIDKSDLQ